MKIQPPTKPPVQESGIWWSGICLGKECEIDGGCERGNELCPAGSDSDQNHSMDTPITLKENNSHCSYSSSESAVHQPKITTQQGEVSTFITRSGLKQLCWITFVLVIVFIVILLELYSGSSFTQKDLPVGPDLRLMMLGTSGAGKSASGNTILGRNVFRAEASPVPVTENCQEWTESVEGRRITVVDTPSIMEMWQSPDQVLRCIKMASPGPNVFLPVIRLGSFMEEERTFMKWISKFSGGEALNFTMVIFTGEDQLEGKSVEKFLDESVELQKLIELCGHRYHVLNNRNTRDYTQVSELIKKIDRMTYNRSIFNISTVSLNEWRHLLMEDEERCRLEEIQIREEEEKKWEEVKKNIREVEKKRCQMKIRDVREEEEWKMNVERTKRIKQENQKKKSWWKFW